MLRKLSGNYEALALSREGVRGVNEDVLDFHDRLFDVLAMIDMCTDVALRKILLEITIMRTTNDMLRIKL